MTAPRAESTHTPNAGTRESAQADLTRTPRSAARATRARPVRVCVLAPALELVGGQARQAERLMNGLADEPSVEISFIPHAPRLPGPFGALQRMKYVRTVINTIVYWASLVARLWRYDVVHAYSASYWSFLLTAAPAILIGKAYRKRVLLNYHSGEADDHLRNWPLTAGPIIRLADLIVVPSGYLVDVFAQYGLTARTIFNVVDIDVFTYRERVPIRPVFLTSRIHEPLYNVPCAFRAFARVQREYPDASLVVAGDGPLRPHLEALAADLELRNTRFVGRIAGKDMPAVYDAADIFLTATNIDNMPGSIIECLSCGLPVVTTEAGGIPYIVTHEQTAMIVPLDDDAAMAASSMRLLGDEQLVARLARNGRAEARQYTWGAVRERWLDAYHALADGTLPR
jgi:glycosyltransferase involved in cell wall biosynthesis